MEKQAPTLKYDDARYLIQSGDLLSFRPNDHNWLHELTLKVTNSVYYHTGIAVWLTSRGGTRRLFVCEAHREGRRLVPLSMYSRHSFDVECCPVDYKAMDRSLLDPIGSVHYGFLDFIGVGVRKLFGIQLKDQNGEICSEMAQKEYGKVGFVVPDYPLSPGEMKSYLNDRGIPTRVKVRP